MARPSRLLYLKSNTDNWENADVVMISEDKIPVGWILCFGGRNFCEPDDHVEDRGGASGSRNRFQTPLEVAEARLMNSISGLETCRHIWVWYAALRLLHRRVQARGKKGLLRIDANWAFAKPKQRERMNQAPALAENIVHLASTNKPWRIATAAHTLDAFCPYIPKCNDSDLKAFQKTKGYKGLDDPCRAAALMVGTPPDNPDRFIEAAHEIYQPEFEKLSTISIYPSPPKEELEKMKAESGLADKLFGFLKR